MSTVEAGGGCAGVRKIDARRKDVEHLLAVTGTGSGKSMDVHDLGTARAGGCTARMR